MDQLVSRDRAGQWENRPTVLPFAVAVGLMLFFLADAVGGGLTGVQGFLMGVLGVIALFLLAGALAKHRERKKTGIHSSVRKDVTVERSENGDEITVRIHLRPESQPAR